MFENILGQAQVVEDLRRALSRGSLPSSLLFHGADYSGKLSCALELARALTCPLPEAPWNCDCPSCEQQRLLIHPFTLMVGERYFRDEIEACASVYQRINREPARYLFVRSVRKLLRRYDPAFCEAKEPAMKRVQSFLTELEEKILSFQPGAKAPEGEALDRELNQIGELVAKITASGGGNKITIDHIRRITVWAYGTSKSPKVVILENADRMNDSARNALLRILEDPPFGVTFILLTANRGGIIPTIRSRLRPYCFLPRNRETSREIMEKIFRVTNHEYASLREYFLAWHFNLEGVRRGAHRFLGNLKNGDPLDRENLEELFPKGENHQKILRVFLQEILAMLEGQFSYDSLIEKPLRGAQFSQWCDLFRHALIGSEQYNRNPILLVEGLYYDMRGTR